MHSLNSYQTCMSDSGLTVTLNDSDGSRVYGINSSPDSRQKSSALAEMVILSKTSDADTARATMNARIDVSEILFKKMLAKYSEESLKNRGGDFSLTDTFDDGAKKGLNYEHTLNDFQKLVDALEAARKDIAVMVPVKNGEFALSPEELKSTIAARSTPQL